MAETRADIKARCEQMQARYEQRLQNQRDSIERLLEHLAVAHGQFDHECPGCPDTGGLAE